MSIVVIKPGLLTTVQDAGRFGYQSFGVPTAGVMDPRAQAAANLLLGNEAGEAVLETTLIGPELLFEEACTVALTGADASPRLTGEPVPSYAALPVPAGSRLSLAPVRSGMRSYLAFAGGLDLPPVMGSRSTCLKGGFGGYEGRALRAGDRLTLREPGKSVSQTEKRRITPENRLRGNYLLRAVPGPQTDCFPQEAQDVFWSSRFTVSSECDRMGARLSGPVIEARNGGNIISEGVAFGAIQVPGAGQPIIMLADHQTTGGYAKIAQVISADFRLIGQLRAGDTLRFRAVTPDEARAAYLWEHRQLENLKKIYT